MRPQRLRGAVGAQAPAAGPTPSRQHPRGRPKPKVLRVTHARECCNRVMLGTWQISGRKHVWYVSREEQRCNRTGVGSSGARGQG